MMSSKYSKSVETEAVERATQDPRWKNATAYEAQKLIEFHKGWLDYDEWAHEGMHDPHTGELMYPESNESSS